LRDVRVRGAITAPGATIAGDVDCGGARLHEEDGPALCLDGCEITGDVLLTSYMTVFGEVSCRRARITGSFEVRDASLGNPAGDHQPNRCALRLRQARMMRLVVRRTFFTGRVDLSEADVGTLDDDVRRDAPGSWQSASPLELDGFTYARFADGVDRSTEARFRWLGCARAFQPGPWRQLLETYRREGSDDDATRTAIEMNERRLRSGGLSRRRKAGRWVVKLLVGHGYRPWLAGVWALPLIALFAAVVWRQSDDFVAADRVEGDPQPIVYSLDTFVPIIDFGQADSWAPPIGWVMWLEWTVVLLGWILSSIVVAGFTRVVRTA
jgi:hypothetical protein